MLAAATGIVAAQPAGAAGTVAYDNIPSSIPGNVSSLGYQATSTQEFGDEVNLATSGTPLTSARVLMSSWGCQTGGGATCVTTPGATFSHPITFNVYAVNNPGPNPTVGALLTTKTQTFNIPYRPSADPGCGSGGQWSVGGNCFNGFAVPITFDFTNAALQTPLPAQVIWTVAFNTTTHGYNPIGAAACGSNCPYDSLNVGLNDVAPNPSVGTDTNPDGAFWNTSFAGFYCDNGAGGVGTLRLDTGVAPNCTPGGDWTGFAPAGELTLAPAPPPPVLTPGAPRNASGVPGAKSVKVFWQPPFSHGATPISGYVVTPYIGGVAQAAQTFNSTATNAVVTGLTNKTTYSFKVAAINAAGTGPQSATTGFVIAGAPGRPGNVKAVRGATAGKLKVTFTAPVNNGSKVTSYTAICKSSNGGALAQATRSKSPIGVSGATVGKTYSCGVIATNARGAGTKSLLSANVVA